MLEILTDGLKFDAMLRKQVLILFKPVYEIAFLKALLSTSRWLWWNHSALNLGFDAVGTWLVLVAADLALLAENAAGTAGQLESCSISLGLLLQRRLYL